jgi:hypothetical protein
LETSVPVGSFFELGSDATSGHHTAIYLGSDNAGNAYVAHANWDNHGQAPSVYRFSPDGKGALVSPDAINHLSLATNQTAFDVIRKGMSVGSLFGNYDGGAEVQFYSPPTR